MSLPPPSLTVPTLSADQIYFNSDQYYDGTYGIKLGYNTCFGITKIEGLDKPNVRSGNTSRPRQRGSYVGLNLLDTRKITVTLDVGPFSTNFGGYANLAGALTALKIACSTEGTTEYPLWILLPNQAYTLACMARVLQKSIPWDVTADLGQLAQNCALQFEATDPTFYSAPTNTTTVGLPQGSGGLTFPLSFPLSFGLTNPNTIQITNGGNVYCYPVFVITGPCSVPAVQNTSLPGSPTVSFNISLNTGDQLVVDTDLQTIVYYPNGSSTGTPVPNILVSGSTWFGLAPFTQYTYNYLNFTSADASAVAGTLTVWWASAWDQLT